MNIPQCIILSYSALSSLDKGQETSTRMFMNLDDDDDDDHDNDDDFAQSQMNQALCDLQFFQKNTI